MRYRIELQDYFLFRRLLCRASVEPDKRVDILNRVYVVCPRFRNGIVSPPSAGFQRVETRSSRLPVNVDSSRFGTVSDWDDQQALAGLSWLSFSRSAVWADPRTGQVRSRVLPRCELPTRAKVERAFETFTRFAHCNGELWLEPPG